MLIDRSTLEFNKNLLFFSTSEGHKWKLNELIPLKVTNLKVAPLMALLMAFKLYLSEL